MKLHDLESNRIEYTSKARREIKWLVVVPVLLIMCGLLLNDWLLLGGLISSLLALGYWMAFIRKPIRDLLADFKKLIISKFMSAHYPKADFKYQQLALLGKKLLQDSGLFPPNHSFEESDVILGKSGDHEFYFSELLAKSSGQIVFNGLIFFLKSTDTFPRSIIRSRPTLKEKWFGDFLNTEFNFWYESDDPLLFEDKLRPLFPFIAHLSRRSEDLRIRVIGDHILICMATEVNFLGQISTEKSFLEEHTPGKFGQHLNSLLYIVEAFSQKLKTPDIEQRLELLELELQPIPSAQENKRGYETGY